MIGCLLALVVAVIAMVWCFECSSVPATPEGTIRVIDDLHYEVPRATIRKLLADPMSMAEGGRMRPLMRDGQALGFMLDAVRPSSLYAVLRLRNGDLLRALNGIDLASRDASVMGLAALENADQLVIEVTRQDQPFVLIIAVTN